jgi:hypothetical protein
MEENELNVNQPSLVALQKEAKHQQQIFSAVILIVLFQRGLLSSLPMLI